MNREHFKAFLWLRWRLRVNQFRKGGSLNLAFFFIIAACSVMSAVGFLIAGFFVGWLALPEAPQPVRLFVWSGVTLALLFFWTLGLLTDLQRSESLALDKFLHLPVSLGGAFTINYVSSLFSLTLLVFVPGIIGLIAGQAIAHGFAMLLAFPLLAGFVFAVTAVTYQFQGWLATLMANPRKRRTIVVLTMGSFILLAQAPNLLNFLRPKSYVATDYQKQLNEQLELGKQFTEKKISSKEYQEKIEESRNRQTTEREEKRRADMESAGEIVRYIDLAFPPGWLAAGAADLSQGRVPVALLGTLGFGLIGAASLRRAYRTTLRLYTGLYTSRERTVEQTAAVPHDPKKLRLLEWQLPRVSEHAAAVATAAFRSMTRAPEAKMALLAPIIMAVVFGGIALSTDGKPPPAARPIILFGVASMILLISGMQLIGNQFGYDRTGFRAYVLSPIPRKEILIGKNLAVAPLALSLALVGVVLVGIVFPLRIDHYPAAIFQLVSSYLLFCLVGNILSIIAPMAMAPGSLQASNVRIVPVFMQMMVLMFYPVVLFPVVLPIGVEALLEQTDTTSNIPISLPLSIVVLGLTLLIYRFMIRVEGDWLQTREKAILEVVTSKSE